MVDEILFGAVRVLLFIWLFVKTENFVRYVFRKSNTDKEIQNEQR